MNIGQVLHARWAANNALNTLLPVAKVMTGTFFAIDPVFPYATITRPGDTTEDYDNEGAAKERVTVRVTVYHHRDNYDEGLAIADAVKSAFDRSAFDLSGSDKVLNMQRTGYEELQDEKDNWYFVIDFVCTVHLASGV
jgi:hypothetical protein